MVQHVLYFIFSTYYSRKSCADTRTNYRCLRCSEAEGHRCSDKLTLRLVREKIKQIQAAVSADELAGQAGMSHSTVRRYLEYMVSIQEVEVDIIYGTVGRPERKYKWHRRA
ncbi:hypothetical protein [Paenibacillus sp. YYML68]|uniref:hypothetical protein n=1 Tax=Paenibacillus sp. YYML68 TaxID=2909250 RepID=UPI0037CB3E96